jgi:hypothetical protein
MQREESMADSAVVHIGENSPEQVAFKLMELIASVEARESYGHGDHPMTREWILRTYDQCLEVVRGGAGERCVAKYQPESFARRR